VDSPHKESDLIGQSVDLDLLSLSPQMGVRIMEILGRKGKIQSQQWTRDREREIERERESGRSNQHKGEKGDLLYPPKQNLTIGIRIIKNS
jgi:hypothetical protein